MEFNFKGKGAVVTGGAKGIGESCTRAFAEAGARVVILDIDHETAGNLAQELGESVAFIKCDVTKESEVKRAMSEAMAHLGSLHFLVNNAGIQRYTKVCETTEEEWDLVLNVNLKSAFLCAKHAIPFIQKNGVGAVINMSSVQAFVTQDSVAPYTTSKTALLGLTRSIAVDYGPAIRSVAICPGTVDTPMLRNAINLSPDPSAVLQECVDMHLTGRIGSPDEIAAMVLFCCSDQGAFLTGQPVRIDGGLGIKAAGSKKDA